MPATDINVLPVGHPARPAAARALTATAVSAIVFTGFAAVTTQIVAVRAVSPWQDDPYDAVVTFTMFFVPGLSAIAALRALLCQRAEPLPPYRVDQLLRGALLVLALIDITVLADCISLAVHADQQLWSGRTLWPVVGLAIVMVAVVVSHVEVRRARTAAPGHRFDDGDWKGDVVVAVALIAVRTGEPSRFTGLRRFLVVIVRFIRAHFVVMAALGSMIAGAVVVARLAVAEGTSDGALFVIEAVIFAGGLITPGSMIRKWDDR